MPLLSYTVCLLLDKMRAWQQSSKQKTHFFPAKFFFFFFGRCESNTDNSYQQHKKTRMVFTHSHQLTSVIPYPISQEPETIINQSWNTQRSSMTFLEVPRGTWHHSVWNRKQRLWRFQLNPLYFSTKCTNNNYSFMRVISVVRLGQWSDYLKS